MSQDVRPDATADDGYWQSLLAEVEAAEFSTLHSAVPTKGTTHTPPSELDAPLFPFTRPAIPDGATSHQRGMAATPRAPVDSTPPSTARIDPHRLEALWGWASAVHSRNETVEGVVTGFNRGGLLITVGELPGFVPASHMVGLTRWTNDDDRAQQLGKRIGERLRLKVIELNIAQNRFILSERLAQTRQKDGSTLLQQLKVGDLCTGKVNHLTDFGAFVDLGGIDGLIHVSEISWERVTHPRDLLQLGQEIQVCVISIEPEKRRIQLSLKRLHPDPWLEAAEHFQVGQIVEGTVTHVTDFGAFARLEEGLEGLIHASELVEDSLAHPASVVRVGDRVRARVLSIDGARRRLALSLRLAPSD